ncbi:PREDICTED: pentatricopeptide repeat-containing protein At1g80270, mitochondrial-like [Ipomoea nil]|uniref:pentatricopeptide repeat-containing protein At1g80270, mitochondrial-like n=1 Tax=Ipomoea nil TaxID=35883 RepID=UPI000901751B|nr:PREDICTED: pentatricopeptide repeat-containing protein At1g80270, mitochondrial-like [Ipomoea nil]
MWALRHASASIRKQGLNTGSIRICFATSELSNRCFEEFDTGINTITPVVSDRCLPVNRFYRMGHSAPISFKGSYGFSSQAVGTRSSGEEDDKLDGIPELESPTASDPIQDGNANNDDGLVSEPEHIDEDSDDEGAEGSQSELGDTMTRISQKKAPYSEIVKAILAAFPLSVSSVMDKWVEEGKELTRADIKMAMLGLRKMRMYVAALKLSEWLKSSKHIDFTDRDYASQVDLIAKVSGLRNAEALVQKLPKSFRSEIVYRTLLANCVSVFDVNKSEEVFKLMKDLKLPISCFTCNQLLLLYKRTDKKKIADVLLLMEKENVKPNRSTYKILMDAKGESNDITGMEQVFETMKAEGIEPDIRTKGSLARHYISGGLQEKAETVLKEMETDDVAGNSLAYTILLPLYAAIGKADEVRRIWQLCESNPRLSHYEAAIEAWGKLKMVDEAEAVFDMMVNKYQNLSSKRYSALLNVYANNKMLDKGMELVKQMTENGCHMGPPTWDSIIKLYIQAGEVEKAESVLNKAAKHARVKPMFRSYIVIMDQYAKRGDIHNSEKVFHRMRQAGFTSQFRLYQALIRAYMNAKAPAYGMKERMKADKVFPNKELAAMLSQVDPFRKTAVSEILE